MTQQNKITDFIQGEADCKAGIPHQAGKSKSYDEGYSVQYQLEQIQGANHG